MAKFSGREITLCEAIECATVDLVFLRRAIKEGDPMGEILIRIDDIARRLNVSLEKLGGPK